MMRRFCTVMHATPVYSIFTHKQQTNRIRPRHIINFKHLAAAKQLNPSSMPYVLVKPVKLLPSFGYAWRVFVELTVERE
jgi:hypothetical protein